MTVKIGDRVTKQPRTWHDGTPVKGWPDPQLQGTVKEITRSRHGTFARVLWASGRKDLSGCDGLTVIEPEPAPEVSDGMGFPQSE